MHFTRTGKPVHLHTWDHHSAGTAYQRFNKRVAIKITGVVGSMTCAWVFSVIALISLPAILTEAFHLTVFPGWLISVGLIALVAWLAQTFIQLVLLSVIMVGQNVQQEASDARSAKTFEDTETIVDKLSLETEGGIKVLNDKLDLILGAVKEQCDDSGRTGQEDKAAVGSNTRQP